MTPCAPHAPQPAPWYRHRWPWLLMLGPASVLAGGAIATWLALGHPDAMVVDDYYKQGKAINQDLRRDRAASAMRLALRLRWLPPRDGGGGRLEGEMLRAGQGTGAPFTLHLAHPTLPERDLLLPVQPGRDGRFSVPLPALERTRWQVVAEGGLRDWRLAHSWNGARPLAIDADR